MKYLILLSLPFFFFSCIHKNPEIFQWKGKDRKGIYEEENLVKSWPEDGPEELWYLEGIGNGYGSPTLTDNEIFITGEIDSISYLFCISTEGKINWKSPIGKEWVKSYTGSRSAPTIIGNLIYAGTGLGNLYCMNRKNGEIIWQKEFKKDFQGNYPLHGHSEAPLTDGDKIFWTPGGKEHNVVALNRFTGELLWSNRGCGERSAYNPGTLIRLPEKNIFVTFSAYKLMGFDTESGKLLWIHAQDNTPEEKRKIGIGDTHCNCVVFDDGYIYYAAGDGNGGVKLKLSNDGSEISEVWRNTGFDSYMGAIVKIDKHIYGSGTSKRELKSIDAESGILADSLKLGWGAVIAADEMLYYYGQNGKLSLINYQNGKLKIESQFKIKRGTKEHFSHPVIKNGILYQRRGNTLMAFNIKKD